MKTVARRCRHLHKPETDMTSTNQILIQESQLEESHRADSDSHQANAQRKICIPDRCYVLD